MSQNSKRALLIALGACTILILVLLINKLIQSIPEKKDPPVTAREETYAAVIDSDGITHIGNLDKNVYPADSPAGQWLEGCGGADRDDLFNAYVLSHAAPAADGKTTFTFLVYFRHEESGYAASPALFEGESGNFRIDMTYTLGSGHDDYALSYISVTLPSTEVPRVRLIAHDDNLGSILTEIDTPIPQPAVA